MKTLPIGATVERKDKDFNNLRQVLVTRYPHLLIPACPPHFSQTKLDEAYTQKKMELLEVFMNKLLQNEELKACPTVLDFIQKKGQKEHSAKLKTEAGSVKAPKGLMEYQTLTGSYTVSSDKKSEGFCDVMSHFVRSHEGLFKKMNELSKQLITDVLNMRKTIEQMSKCSEHISKAYASIASPDLTDVYSKLSSHLATWSKNVGKESKVLYNAFPKQFRYDQLESQSFTELFNNR